MKNPIVFFVLLFVSITLFAQHTTHEIGVFVGQASVQTDFGQRGNTLSEIGNHATSITVAHYFHFYNKDNGWNGRKSLKDHIMFKSTVNIVQGIKLQHYGKHVEGNGKNVKILRAMEGQLQLLNFGMQVEYHFKNLHEYMNRYTNSLWSPFVNAGVRYIFYTNNITSELGNWKTNITVLPQKYQKPEAIKDGDGNAFAFSLETGSRFKLSKKIDLETSINYLMFMSDSVDGLQANVIENKNNESLLNVQIGIIFALN